jgi:hypothetical protein
MSNPHIAPTLAVRQAPRRPIADHTDPGRSAALLKSP